MCRAHKLSKLSPRARKVARSQGILTEAQFMNIKPSSEYHRKWRLRNPEYHYVLSLEQKKEKYKKENERLKTDIQFKLSRSLRRRLRDAIKRNSLYKKHQNPKAGSFVGDLGCTVAELKIHIESKFQEGMSWGNWGHRGKVWHIDHIIPLVSVDLTDREQFLKVSHYTNLQPLWAHENQVKGIKPP
jgi:hypothetical protein